MRTIPTIRLAILATALLLATTLGLAGSAEDTLEKTVESYKVSGTLTEAITQLQQLAGVPIQPDWPAIEDTGVKRTDRVSLAGKNTKLKQIIDLMLAQVSKKGKPLAHMAQEGSILLSTQQHVISARMNTNYAPSMSVKVEKSDRPGRPRVVAMREFNFNAVNFEDVIEYFREISGVNFHVSWRALENVGVTRETQVTLKASGITIGKALDLVLEGVNGNNDRMSKAYWVVDGGVVRISTGTDLNTITRTRVFDVSDLLFVIPNFVGPRVDIDSVGSDGEDGGGGGDFNIFHESEDAPGSKEQDLSALREEQKQALLDMIKNSIGQEMWADYGGPGTIQLFQKRLIITQSLLGFKMMEEGVR
jgi:hypothetical protein